MPYFKWRTINLHGKLHKGFGRFLSLQDLERYMLNKDCAILDAHQVDHWSLLRPISDKDKDEFFRHVALLLQSGVFLDQALTLVQKQISNKKLAEIIEDLSLAVTRGYSFADALRLYPTLFDSITLTLVHAGEQTGKLSIVLTLLADHHEIINQFFKKLRNAGLMPLITLAFFCLIGGILIMFVVPSFTVMFNSVNKQLPTSTRALIWLSKQLTKEKLAVAVMLVALAYVLLRRAYRASSVNVRIDALVFSVPLLGTIIKQMITMYCLQALSILLMHGVPLLQALQALSLCIKNHFIKQQLESIIFHINNGFSLSYAFNQTQFATEQVAALVAIGQESATLAPALARGAEFYQQNIQRQLTVITLIVQPLLMILLGLLIVGLIISIYLPILELSNAIS